jgi:hypothetical protein
VIYRCLADGTTGAGTEPPNSNYWARHDNPQLGNFGFLSEQCTTGHFIVDDIVLTKIESGKDDSNLIPDPAFSKTTSNSDKRYWNWGDDIEWGSEYGFNSSPGLRLTLNGSKNWIAEQDGESSPGKHAVEFGNRVWIKYRVMRSTGADGVFGVGIQEWDNEDNHLGDTVASVSSIESDDTWEVVSASITVQEAGTAFCNLFMLFYPSDGAAGYFYIDDVHFSQQDPAITFNDTNNLLQDPCFQLTQSNTDIRYWWLNSSNRFDVEWNTFDTLGQFDANGNPAVRINNIGDGIISWLWEKTPYPSRFTVRTFPIGLGDRFYVEARVFESPDSDADDPNDFKAVIWAGDHDRISQSFNSVTLRPSDKGMWQTVSGEITIFQPNPDDYDEWSASATYNNDGDIVKHDTNGTGDYLLYRCLADGTTGAATEPPNRNYWARYDNPQLGNFGIYSENCTAGHFLVDDVILSPRHEP